MEPVGQHYQILTLVLILVMEKPMNARWQKDNLLLIYNYLDLQVLVLINSNFTISNQITLNPILLMNGKFLTQLIRKLWQLPLLVEDLLLNLPPIILKLIQNGNLPNFITIQLQNTPSKENNLILKCTLSISLKLELD